MRRRISILIVVTCALLTGACADGGGGSPTAPTVPSVPDMSVDPAKGDFQVKDVVTDKPSGTVLHDGDSWRVDATMYCRPGLLTGLIFVRDDGVRIPYPEAAVCPAEVRFIIRPTAGRIGAGLPPTIEWSKGHEITVEFGMATSSAEWFANQGQIVPGLHLVWRVE